MFKYFPGENLVEGYFWAGENVAAGHNMCVETCIFNDIADFLLTSFRPDDFFRRTTRLRLKTCHPIGRSINLIEQPAGRVKVNFRAKSAPFQFRCRRNRRPHSWTFFVCRKNLVPSKRFPIRFDLIFSWLADFSWPA